MVSSGTVALGRTDGLPQKLPEEAVTRRIEQLIVCRSGDPITREKRSRGERLLVTSGSVSGADTCSIALAGTTDALSSEQFVLLQDWLTEHAAKLPLALRASLLAQLPFLVSWASVRRQFALQLDHTLSQIRPTRLVLGALPNLQLDLIESYGQSHGIESKRLEQPIDVLKRKLPPLLHVKRAYCALRNGMRAALTERTTAHRPELLVVSLQPNSTRSILPVAQKLAENGTNAQFLLQTSDSRSLDLVRSAKFPLDVIERRQRVEDAVWSYRAVAAFFEETDGNELRDLVDRMGFPAWVDRDRLATLLRIPFQRNLQASCFQTRGVERGLEELDPRAVLFITNRAMMNELLGSRKERTRRIFFLQGIVPEIPPVSTHLDVDLAIVGSAIDVPYTRRCGVPPDVLRVTGYPDYDKFLDLSKGSCRREAEERIVELESKPLVVFTSQYVTEVFPPWARRKNIEILSDAARLLPDVLILFKSHPLRDTLAKELRSKFPTNLVTSPPFDTHRALRAADVAVTYWSTTALESVLLGTPLVQLNGTGLPDYFDISGKLGRPTARTAEELAQMIRDLIFSRTAREEFAKDREKFLLDQGLLLDGGATERAAQEIARVL